MSALYGPRIAAPSILVIDVFAGAALRALGLARMRCGARFFPLAASALLAAQFGSLILIYADPI